MTTATVTRQSPERVSKGIDGVSSFPSGGSKSALVHRIDGTPDTGKITRALYFLTARLAAGVGAPCARLLKTKVKPDFIGTAHGWSLAEFLIRHFGRYRELQTRMLVPKTRPGMLEQTVGWLLLPGDRVLVGPMLRDLRAVQLTRPVWAGDAGASPPADGRRFA